MNIRIFIALILLNLGNLYSQCEGYFPLNEGTLFEFAHYNGKGKLVSTNLNRIDFAAKNDEGIFEIQVESTVLDDKKEEVSKGNYTVKCVGDEIILDMNALLNPAVANMPVDVEASISGTGVALPHNLAVGQKLSDADMTIQIGNNGLSFMTMSFLETNRMVETKESVTTPAGNFECFVVSYDLDVKTILSKKMKVKEWFAKGFGLIKSEVYDKKGKLESRSEMVKFQQ